MTEPAANPQAQTEEMVDALTDEQLTELQRRYDAYVAVSSFPKRAGKEWDALTMGILGAMPYLISEIRQGRLSRPATDRGQIETCPFCGGDELNLADNEYRSRAIARLNNIARGQIVEECARRFDAFARQYGLDLPSPVFAAMMKAIASVRALSSPAQTEEYTMEDNSQGEVANPRAVTETEPDFLSQTSEPMTREQRSEWFRMRVSEAVEQGATWHRYSSHPDDESLLLYEGWRVRPENAGEPRFQFTPGAEKG